MEHPLVERGGGDSLFNLCRHKPPDPNGSSMAFWQFSRDFVKQEVMGFFWDLFHNIFLERSLNATFLVLIPKKGGAKDLKDFKPISLVGGYISEGPDK